MRVTCCRLEITVITIWRERCIMLIPPSFKTQHIELRLRNHSDLQIRHGDDPRSGCGRALSSWPPQQYQWHEKRAVNAHAANLPRPFMPIIAFLSFSNQCRIKNRYITWNQNFTYSWPNLDCTYIYTDVLSLKKILLWPLQSKQFSSLIFFPQLQYNLLAKVYWDMKKITSRLLFIYSNRIIAPPNGQLCIPNLNK